MAADPTVDYLSAMARMQERQANWGRRARETSEVSGSVSASTSSPSDTSPPHINNTLKPVAPAPSSANPSPSRANQPGTKTRADGKVVRKKVAKACLACQKSHLTCDECRPCTRCMKKGIGDQCVEGVRKKAKYLMEGDERAAPLVPVAPPPTAPQQQAPHPSAYASASTGPFGSSIPVAMLQPGVVPPRPEQQAQVPDNIWLTAPLPDIGLGQPLTDWGIQPNDPFNFSSSAAANLEYEMFDSMFGSMSPPFALGDISGGAPSSTDGSTPTLWSNFGLADPNQSGGAGAAGAADNNVLLTPQDHPSAGLQPMLANDLSSQGMYGNGWGQPGQLPDEMAAVPAPEYTPPKKLTADDVFKTIVTPYDYTEGYHVLMKYLTTNFEKNEILRVVRALAAFRPSLIALQMSMSEEDEVFLERSFLRTQIELEKLISYSATPTAIWRRTGEVVCVAPQFCQLVGKTEDEILRSRMCIYQLFSKQATIEYWENFAVHAFENTTQNFFQPTTLDTGKGTIPCAASYTIRRDVFDLPSMIVGQFLPIPPEAMH